MSEPTNEPETSHDSPGDANSATPTGWLGSSLRAPSTIANLTLLEAGEDDRPQPPRHSPTRLIAFAPQTTAAIKMEMTSWVV